MVYVPSATLVKLKSIVPSVPEQVVGSELPVIAIVGVGGSLRVDITLLLVQPALVTLILV